METVLVPKHGYAMEWIRFSGLRGKGMVRMALLPLNLLIAFWQSARVIFRVRPDVVLGMGGYVSFPGGMMAAFFNRPLVVHEQNSIAGLANRVLAEVADYRLAGFPGVLRKSRWCGNPVRRDISQLAAPAERFRGRSGCAARCWWWAAAWVRRRSTKWCRSRWRSYRRSKAPMVTHQAGVKHLEQLRENYAKAGRAGRDRRIHRRHGCALCPGRLGDLPRGRADRCGAGRRRRGQRAGAVSPRRGRPPDAQRRAFSPTRGAAVLVQQPELSPRRLADLLLGFTREKLLEMADRARALAKPDAAAGVASVCIAAAG